MDDEQETDRQITRRAAIQRIAAAGATVGTAAILGGVQIRASEASKHFVEKQPTGSEIWQVTTEDYWHWNIYCEVPYCSADSKYFVYSRIRRNPTVGINRTEFMVWWWNWARGNSTSWMSGSARLAVPYPKTGCSTI